MTVVKKWLLLDALIVVLAILNRCFVTTVICLKRTVIIAGKNDHFYCIVLHYSFAAVKTLRSTRVQYLTLIGPVSIRVCTKHFSKMIINVRHAARSLQHLVLKMFFIYGNWCSFTLILVTVGNSFCWWLFWVIVSEIL